MNPSAISAHPAPGTAEALAHIAHFRDLDVPDIRGLDTAAVLLMGDVGGRQAARDLWQQLQPTCMHLWHLIADDWDDRDLDALPDGPEYDGLTGDHAETTRYWQTRDRLAHDIEQAIWLARYRTAEATRLAVSA